MVETSKINYPLVNDISSIDKNDGFIPISLRIFLQKLFLEKNSDTKIASIGQAIIQATRPRVLIAPLQEGLAVQMHHHFGSKFLIDSLNSHGFCSSYSEVKEFEVSAADAQDKEIPGFTPGQFVQFIADNVDHNVRTLDGANTFHGMGIIAVRSPEVRCNKPIARIKKTAEELALQSRIKTKFYRDDITALHLLKYEKLSAINILDFSWKVDFLWKISWPLKSPQPLWSGMMQAVNNGETPDKSSITFLPMIDMDPGDMSCIYSTLLFVSAEASSHNVTPVVTFDQPLWWKALTIISCERDDSQLKSIVLRLDAFHMQMSFLGSIGYLMHDSGLKETLETIYAPNAVTHILSGKAVSRAVRGHFIVDSALNAPVLSKAFGFKNLKPDQFPAVILSDNAVQENSQCVERDQEEITNNEDESLDTTDDQIIISVDSNTTSTCYQENSLEDSVATSAAAEDFSVHLLREGIDIYERLIDGRIMPEDVHDNDVIDCIAKRLDDISKSMKASRTSTLWLQYTEMLDILRQFIKAERTGNWQLHLKSTYEMLPYFAASGHNLYAKSAIFTFSRCASWNKPTLRFMKLS